MMRRALRVTRGLLVGLLVVSLGVGASASAPEGRASDKAQATLSNGMRVLAIRNTVAPVVSTWMTYLAGSDDDGDQPGLAHAAEHMMFRGSPSVSGSQFADTVAMMGGHFNGETAPEATYYYLEVPAQHLDVAMRLEAARAEGVLDDATVWEHERGAISQEVAMRNSSAGYRMTTRVASRVLDGTAYANEGLGTVSSFNRMNIDAIRAFHAKYYRPNNAVYVVVGDVDPEDVVARASRIFGSVPSGGAIVHDAAVISSPRPASPIVDTESVLPTHYAVLGFRLPGTRDADYAAARVLIEALGDPRGPLADVRTTSDVLQLSASLRPFPGASVGFIGSTIRKTGDVRTSVGRLKESLAALRRAGIDANFVQAAKRRLETEDALAISSISAEARVWSRAVAIDQRSPLDQARDLSSVTADDVNRVLRDRMSDDLSVEALALSNPNGKPSRSEIGTTEQGAVVTPKTHTPLPPFARSLDHVSAPASWVTPSETVLANGLRVVVVHNDSASVVALRGFVDANSAQTEPVGVEGVDSVIERVYREGREGADRSLAAANDALGTSLDTGMSFGFDIQSSRFDEAVAALAEAETRPPLGRALVESAISHVADDVRALSDSPSAKSENALCDGLYGSQDLRCRVLSPEHVAKLTSENVIRRFEDTFRPEKTTIIIVGNVGVARAKAVVEREFGAWSRARSTSAAPRIPVVLNDATRTEIVDRGRRQAQVVMAQVVGINRNHPDYVALRLANALLTGGSFGSFLYEDLRERTGYVYGVSSQLQPSSNDTTFEIAFGADASNVNSAITLINRRLDDLREHPADAARLARAKALLINDIPVAAESFAGAAFRIQYYLSGGMPADTAYREARAMSTLTAEDVRRAVARRFRSSKFATVVQGGGLNLASDQH